MRWQMQKPLTLRSCLAASAMPAVHQRSASLVSTNAVVDDRDLLGPLGEGEALGDRSVPARLGGTSVLSASTTHRRVDDLPPLGTPEPQRTNRLTPKV